jgi:hypothetical protein
MSIDPRLVVVLNLLRIYKDVLEEPAPADLMELLERLEQSAVFQVEPDNRLLTQPC